MLPDLTFSPEFARFLELWVGGLLTLMIFSFLYKDNVFYKFAEHLFVGISAAYWMVQGFWGTLIPNLFGKLYPPSISWVLPSLADNTPDPFKIIPLIFGILLLMRLVPPVAVASRMAMGLVIGFAAGTNLTRFLQSDFVAQIDHSMEPILIYNAGGGIAWYQSFNALVLVTGVLAGLVYFFFSAEHKGLFGKVSRYGIWVLMISFGAAFGYTVMARISLLTGRMQFLGDWISNPFPF